MYTSEVQRLRGISTYFLFEIHSEVAVLGAMWLFLCSLLLHPLVSYIGCH